MLDALKTVSDLLTGRSPEDLAKLTAYLLAPGLVLALAASGVYSPGLPLDFGRPITVSELRTEVNAQGQITGKRGLALLLEPVPSEYSITLGSPLSMWLSLDEATLRANAGRLALRPDGLNGHWPLIGVDGPVTVIVQGEPSGDILIPGGRERLDEWQAQSRRSVSLVSSVLLACVFAFGMSLATGLPALRSDQETARKERAKPDKQ